MSYNAGFSFWLGISACTNLSTISGLVILSFRIIKRWAWVSPLFWNSTTHTKPKTFPKISLTLMSLINLFNLRLNTLGHKSGLSQDVYPGNKFSSISFQHGLHVKVRNKSGRPKVPTIDIESV